MKYIGIIQRVLYTNIGVEADSLGEARSKVMDLARALSPDIYDYEDVATVHLKEWNESGNGVWVDYLKIKKNHERRE